MPRPPRPTDQVRGLVPRILARGRPVIGSIARSLPPPRDQAFVDLLRAAWTLATGQGRGVRDPRSWANPIAVYRARAALRAGRADVALARARRILRDHPGSPGAIDVERIALGRLGELSAAVGATGRLRRERDEESVRDWERRVIGRMAETDPAWRPRVPGPARPVDPDNPERVLHLLKESLPYRQNGFTLRSRYSLLAQRQAGLDPVVVTSLGFPRAEGIDPVPRVEEVDGIAHHRLDAGPDYPVDPPYDEILADQAWLTARVARAVRPAILHASSGYRGYETALVGLAVRDHIRRPLVYEVRSFFETTWSPDASVQETGEYFSRRRDTELRCMAAADAVITIAEAMRDEIVERGVPREKVFVIPNGVDPEAFKPRPPNLDLRRRLGLDGRFVIGYVSNLDHPREGQEILIEATARLVRRGRPVTCLLVGDGRRRAELEGLAEDLRVTRNVLFTGSVPHDQVADHYMLIDAFVVPRRDERAARLVTPLKPFEAMALGRPLIVADLPALTEIAAPDKRGLAFRAGDPDALAAVVERLIDNPGETHRMADRARKWVLRERTWAANGRRYREVYDAVLRGELGGGAA